MQSNIKILILGGDARYLEVIDSFSELTATIYVAGYDKLTFTQANVHQVTLLPFDYSHLDAILLPVSGCGISGEIDVTYSDQPITLTNTLIKSTAKHCVIYTGTANSFLEDLTRVNNRKLVKIFDRDDVAILNSIPTAEATLNIAIENTDVTIHGAPIIIFGFGRVGMTTARLFDAVGAKVTICARNPASIARIIEMGFTPVRMETVNEAIPKMEVFINTVPYPLIDKQMILSMKKSAVIIDIASSPGGTDFSFAKKQNIKAVHALGLPGKTAPKTAGKIISNAVYESILKQ